MGPFHIADTFRFEHRGAPYLFVVNNAAIVQIDLETRRFLEHLETGPRERDATELEAELARFFPEDEVPEVVAGLVDLEVLVPRGQFVPSSEVGRSRQREELPVLQALTAHVTQDCNLRCTYCYADHGLYGAADKRLMTPEMVRDYVDLLLDESRDVPDVTFTFFGGEPLMNFPAVREGVLYGEREAAARGKRIRFAMTTNGTLFDEDKVSFCVDHGVQVTVSIDGPEHLNDPQRPRKGGRGSYRDTLRRCRPLLEAQRVPARVTITRDNLDVYEIVTHLLGEGFAEVGVTPVASLQASLDLGDEDMEVFARALERTTDRFVSEGLADRFFGFTNPIGLIKQFHEGAARGHPCGAGAGLLAGTVAGELYACHRNVNDRNYSLGNLQDGVDDAGRATFLDEVHVSNKPDCQRCWLRSLCAGGCYHLGSLYEGDKAAVHSYQCPWIRRWYLYALRGYLTLLEDNPSFVERIVGTEAVAR